MTQEQDEQNQKLQAPKTGSTLGGYGLPQEPCRDGLRDRIRVQLRTAQRDAGRGEKLQELEYLLDKYPDVARILELMEVVR